MSESAIGAEITLKFEKQVIDLKKLATQTANGDVIQDGAILFYDATEAAWRPGVDKSGGSTLISAGAVTTATIATDAVTSLKLSDKGVSTSSILDASVTSVKVAANSVTTAKIQDSSVSASKLAASAVITQYNFHFREGGAITGAGVIMYNAGNGNIRAVGEDGQVFWVMPRAGTLKNFTVRNFDAPNPQTLTVTLMKNAVATTAAVTYSTESFTTKNSDSEISVVAGDSITIRFSASDDPGGTQFYSGFFELY
jgi:hypothetical protein